MLPQRRVEKSFVLGRRSRPAPAAQRAASARGLFFRSMRYPPEGGQADGCRSKDMTSAGGGGGGKLANALVMAAVKICSWAASSRDSMSVVIGSVAIGTGGD